MLKHKMHIKAVGITIPGQAIILVLLLRLVTRSINPLLAWSICLKANGALTADYTVQV
jgi:hypothetical protein